ncbi:ABC transporter permease [Photobacterium alginatilyticum]|uniref:ABC transporter permease n=1 Tax=Photobacterium alginatilyticum TaxID=1775171 RepID=A0ABW9YFX9_9GAMM|nr:FtsX-like permease family protein [Photobacterium alginatilyticum]NBI52707.1 ABC transporter permease [Photobacterium alginatilyticum]
MLVKLAWRNLWRNKLRTGIMLSAMVFGLMGVVSMMGFMTGMYGSMIDNAIAWQTSHIQIHNSRYLTNPDINSIITDSRQLIAKIEQLPQVKALSARFVADGMVASARSARGVRINGIDVASETLVTPLAANIRQGEWLSSEGRNPVLVSIKTAERLRLRIGSKVVLTFTNASGDVTGAAFRVRGIFKTPSSGFDEGNVFVRRSDLTALAGIEGSHEIAVLLDDEQAAFALRDELQKQTSAQNTVRDWKQVQPMLASIINQMGTSNAIMLGIFVLALSFGIINIMLMSVFERTREFGVLMAVGMQKHNIFLLIMLETTWLGISGALLGIAGSLGLMQLLQHTGVPLGKVAEGLGAFGVDTTLYPQVSLADYQMIFITVVAASLLAALYPARQILKQRPVDAMAEKH